MTLTFATTALSGDTLRVKFTKEPYEHDLKILLLQWWLPLMIYSFVVVSVLFWFRTFVPALQMCGVVTLLCGTVFYQIARNGTQRAEYTFDGAFDEISRNGILVARLSASKIVLQTRLGWQGNRRFRLVLRQNEKRDIVLTETPLLGPENRARRYYGQTHTENVRTMFHGWTDDSGRRDAVDERDVGIFALAKTLEDFIGQKAVLQ